MASVAAPCRLAAALGLAGIVAAACGVSLIWVFVVPIYQSPDESAHFDYALAIYAHGRPFLAQHTSFERLPETAHPYTAYLEKRTRALEISFSPGAKVEPGYGTAKYFAALDRDVPPANEVTGPNQLAAVYPFGYYTVLAGWIGLVRLFSDSLTVTFFAARIFSVILLAVTLVASYGAIRLLGFSIWFALLLTAGIGLFPLTSFVSSYIQPDNLSWTLVSCSYYFALRGRRNRWPVRDLIPLGLVLGGLVVTKVQFFVCVSGPICALLAADLVDTRTSWRRCVASATVVLAPPLLLGSVYLWTVNGTENYFGPAARNSVSKTVQLFLRAMRDFFYGASHRSFWGVFGWGDTHLVVGNYQTTFALHVLLHLFSAVTLILTITGLTRTARRLIALARQKRIGSAIRLALGNPVVNSLFAFTVVITAVFVHTENRFAAQGRNWLPMILPIFLVGISYAPRALSRPATRGALLGRRAGGPAHLRCRRRILRAKMRPRTVLFAVHVAPNAMHIPFNRASRNSPRGSIRRWLGHVRPGRILAIRR